MKFKGSYVALVTPFDENDNVNFEVLANLIDFHLKSHTDGLVVLGTTAEAATMSQEEKDEVVKFVVKKVNHKIPVIVGSGSNSTKLACLASKRYEELGADALLVITPYYNKTNHTGIIMHFSEVAKSTRLPIIMYNVPGRTGCNLLPETVAELFRTQENIVGLKEATGNLAQASKTMYLTDGKLDLYSGEDGLVVPLMSIGGIGVISVWANLAPAKVHNMCESFFKGDLATANQLQREALPLIDALFCEVNPIPVKEALNLMGKNVGPLRSPLCEMEPANKERLIQAMRTYGLKLE